MTPWPNYSAPVTEKVRQCHNKKNAETSLTVITALALLSAKSSPSLTFPLHTAKNSPPSTFDSSSESKSKDGENAIVICYVN